MREGARERPVRAGTGLAAEMVGSAKPGRQRSGARRRVLTADGHTQAPRGLEHDVGDGRQQTDVMMRIEMRRLNACGENLLDLRSSRMDPAFQ
jgi:hypothetical protein